MTRRIFIPILLFISIALLLCMSVVTAVLYTQNSAEQRTQLRYVTDLMAHGVQTGGEEFIQTLSLQTYRVTWIDADGTVLYDSQVTDEPLENHLQREEVQQALKNGSGESVRQSATLTQKMLYAARLLDDGTILRVAMSATSVFELFLDVLYPMAGIYVLTILISIVVARQIAKRIVGTLGALDLDHPLQNDTYEELTPILEKLYTQRRQIDAQMTELRQHTDEFAQIIHSMNEALVLLDDKEQVVRMNAAAQQLFDTAENIGEDFWHVDRAPVFSRAIRAALKGTHSEFQLKKNGLEYQFRVSRIVSDGKTIGAVILAFDMTEQVRAEQMRREFTANVSHELKTPLQSIIGSAELLENHLVAVDDQPRFVGHIRREAVRLLSLINDIIRLSQLEERGETPMETVDLYAVALEAVEALKDTAKQNEVSIRCTGAAVPMRGVRRYLYEIVYNLCDNAIRYNVPNGHVEVLVRREKENNRVVLSVSDTGIGIAPADQTRVFERFFRVDKSHSKETGGTGLGLSIVKHAVQLHGGQISVQSALGQGTTMTVTFPCATETAENLAVPDEQCDVSQGNLLK